MSYNPVTKSVTVTMADGRSLTFLQDKLSEADIAFLKTQEPKPDPAPGNDAQAISATEANQQMRMGFNFGNIFDRLPQPQNPRPWEKESLATLKKLADAYHELGARNLRLPYSFSTHTDMDTGLIDLSHDKLEKYEKLLAYILEKHPDMWLILNTHHDDWYTGWEDRKDAFGKFWAQLAGHFQDYPYRVIFEVENEPWHGVKGDPQVQREYVREMMSIGLDAIRSTGGRNERRIVMITPLGGHSYHLKSTYPDKDVIGQVLGDADPEYIMMTMHVYGPWTYCGPNNHAEGQSGEDAPVNLDKIAESLRGHADWSESHGIPINAGELGVAWRARERYPDQQIPDQMTEKQIEWYQTVTATLLENEMNYSIWDDNGWFRILDRETLKFHRAAEIMAR